MEKIQQAFIAALLAGFAAWQDRIAWENKSFKAPEGQPWFRFFFMPVEERIRTLGQAGYDEANGLVQIDVNYPVNTGEGKARKTIEELRACFRPGVIAYEGQSVTILSRSRAHGREQDGFYCIPFTIRWRAQLTRNQP
jgi:Bacteriophage related domain of unknown function